MKRKVSIISSFIIMVCLGSIYAWSIFVPELKEKYFLTTAQTQLAFGTVIGVFALAMMWAAHINKKITPHVVATISGALYFIGYLVAFLSKGNFFILWFGIGILGGISTGLGYHVSTSVPVKYYPHKKGVASGIVIAGFAAGVIILTYLASYLIKQGANVLQIFLFQGIIGGAIIILAAQRLREPDFITPVKDTVPITTRHGVLVSQLILGIFAGSFTGLLVIGNLTPIAQIQHIDDFAITLSISVFALATFAGRLVWEWLSNKFSHVYLVPIALLIQAGAAFLLFYIPALNILFISLVALIGFSFGANFVLFAKETINRFDPESYKKVYLFIFLGFGLAGVAGPFTGGRVFDLTGNYLHAIVFACALSFITSILYVLIYKRIKINKISSSNTKLFTSTTKSFKAIL